MRLVRQIKPKQKITLMPEEKDIYEQLLAHGFSKREIHNALYKMIMHQLDCEKAFKQLTIAGKVKWYIKRYLGQVTEFSNEETGRREVGKSGSKEDGKSESREVPVRFINSSLERLTAKGLYLLKTQFAKKPKNPV